MRDILTAFFLFTFLIPTGDLRAQADTRVRRTIQEYERAERLLATATAPLVTGTAGAPVWIGNSSRFIYRATGPDGTGGFWRVDPDARSRVPAFDHARLAAALAGATGSTIAADRLPLNNFQITADGAALSALVNQRPVRCDLQAYLCTGEPPPSAPSIPPSSRLSPDGAWALFRRDHNLWAHEVATGRQLPLTTDGIEDFGYATNNAGWTHNDTPVLAFSPDGRRVATFQHDGRGVGSMYLVTTNVGTPVLEEWKYPLPVDSVIFRVSRVIVDLPEPGSDAPPRIVRFRMPPDQHRSTGSDHIACAGAICDLQWAEDGSEVYFISSSRDHRDAWLRIADANTGAIREVLHERSETQIGGASHPEDLWRILPETDEFIWWSDRDDWTHLYLYDLRTGELKNRITTGSGNVTGIVKLDRERREIWFTAVGREADRDPYHTHLYRVGFDGSDLRLLTPANGNHSVRLSPDGRYVIDTWSTFEKPPVTEIRDRDGQLVQTLETADISLLLETGWRPPIPFTVKARDGVTDIYGVMTVPTNLDQDQKYPIVNRIYPGPQSGSVGSRSFSPSRSDDQALADLGFIVVSIDGMGTPNRSKAFRDYYYGRLGDNTIPDQVAGMKQLAERFPFIDIERAGIWGHSGGGFATAAAMFRAPEFFKVGIAESGNHDNRNYEDDWGERYQGLLVPDGTGSDNYASEATQTYAANLRGRLFLIHGMMDSNVPPYNTLLVADALMKAGKSFDMLMLPHARHGYGADGPYVMRRRWDYFIEHLRGEVPPVR